MLKINTDVISPEDFIKKYGLVKVKNDPDIYKHGLVILSEGNGFYGRGRPLKDSVSIWDCHELGENPLEEDEKAHDLLFDMTKNGDLVKF